MDVHDPVPRLVQFAQQIREDFPNLLSLLVFFSVTALLFRNLQFALIVTASLGFHELGHAAALTCYGLDFRITFGIIGAWTWSPRAERVRLSHLANTLIHLAGPLFSLLLALAAAGLNLLWQPGDNHLLLLANFSAQVGFLNLLPFGGMTDGGKAVQRMVISLGTRSRAWAVLLPMQITAFMLVIYSLVLAPGMGNDQVTFSLLGLLLIGLWMGSSFIIASRRFAPRMPDRWAAARMRPWQVYVLIMMMWSMLALGLVISAHTPFWLSPDFLLGSLRNIADVLRLFSSGAL